METIRTISDYFIESLEKGELSGLTELVRNKDNELIMCFRNNYINVYRKSHSVVKITEQTKKFLAEFNMGHARYTDKDTCEGKIMKLRSAGVSVVIDGKNNTAKFYIPKNGEKFDFTEIIKIYSEFVDDFFDKNKTYDYFRNVKNNSKKGLIEKIHQQRLFSENFPGDNYVYYDLELSFPKNVKGGAPDCLALRSENDMIAAIVLVEVKSTEAACKGKCGIAKHTADFNKIISNKKYNEILKNSMLSTMENYVRLGLLPKKYQLSEKLAFEKLFVFTTEEVREHYNKASLSPNEKIMVVM